MKRYRQLPFLVEYVVGLLANRIKSHLRRGVNYVTEGAEWVIRREGEAILGQLRQLTPTIPYDIITSTAGLSDQVIHFGSIWCFVGNIARTHHNNRLAVTVYHGHQDMPGMEQAWRTLRDCLPRLDAVVTASSLMRERLRAWGVPEHKLHVIPLGVDTELFHPPSPEQRLRERKRLGIPDGSICIGSFQKDGIGWAEGLEPKLIKGPDIFLQVISRLSKRYKVFVLLNGPARGYVKHGLEAAGIPFRLDYTRFSELPSYYHCLDLYLIASREEGGPKALHECMATGVPFVSTRVGMAPDMVKNGVNGILVDSEDVDGLLSGACALIDDPQLCHRVTGNALQTVRQYAYPAVARMYYEEIYSPLIGTGK